MRPNVLIVEDDIKLAQMLVPYLEGQGFLTSHLDHGQNVLSTVRGGGVDVVLLDVMLPDADGFELCRQLREFSDVPIIMLTARGEQTDRVVGLEIGADDYLAKPYDPRELVARIRAVLRRVGQSQAEPAPNVRQALLEYGHLRIDVEGRRLWKRGQPVELTSRQFDLLVLLAERRGRVQSRAQLTEALTGETWEVEDRSIDVHVSRIRSAIEDDPKRPRYLRSVRGAGYVFSVPVEPEHPDS